MAMPFLSSTGGGRPVARGAERGVITQSV